MNVGTKPRGRCPYCGRRFSVNRDGRLRRHGEPGTRRPPAEAQPAIRLCPGSGQWPS